VFEDLVNLSVVWHSAVVESLNDTPELHLPGDIGLQLLSRSGGGNTHFPGVVGDLGCRCWRRHVVFN